MRLSLRVDHCSGSLRSVLHLVQGTSIQDVTEFPPSTRTLDTRQLSMIIVMIMVLFCGKYTVMASVSENEIGLLGVGGGSVNTVRYLLLRASLM